MRRGEGGGQKAKNSSGHVGGTETGLGALRRADLGGCNVPKKVAVGRRSGLPEWPEARRKICLPAQNLGKIGVGKANTARAAWLVR